MNDVPARFEHLIWVLVNMGVPTAIGLAAGVCVRSFLHSAVRWALAVSLVIWILWQCGVLPLDAQHLTTAWKSLPSRNQIARTAGELIHRYPAGLIGLAMGIVLREWWRCRPTSRSAAAVGSAAPP